MSEEKTTGFSLNGAWTATWGRHHHLWMMLSQEEDGVKGNCSYSSAATGSLSGKAEGTREENRILLDLKFPNARKLRFRGAFTEADEIEGKISGFLAGSLLLKKTPDE